MMKRFAKSYKNTCILGRGAHVPSTIANMHQLLDEEDDSINTITDLVSTM